MADERRRLRGSPVRWLILIHRYFGIPLSVLFVIWFVSGVVMMYTGGMPRLTPELQFDRRPPLDFSRVALAPAAAARRAYVAPTQERAALLTVMDRPAYRFGSVTVFADTGAYLDPVGPLAAAKIAGRFTGLSSDALQYLGTLTEPDQWTLYWALVERGRLPVHRFRIDDAAGTELYVSAQMAEVVVLTTSRSRALAWLGAIPHWFYFTALRSNQQFWYDAVVWAAALGCLLAITGLLLGVTQFRWRSRRHSPQAARGLLARIPYVGWMRWHYLTGVVFGVVTLTWVFSGFMSMEPFAWMNVRGLEFPRDALSGGPIELAGYSEVDPAAWDRVAGGRPIKQIELLRIEGDHYYAMHLGALSGGASARDLPKPLLVTADTFTVRDAPFRVESLVARLAAAVPNVPIVASELLADYDAYYYARGVAAHREAPLPVLRVKFADPLETWVYVDPAVSAVQTSVHRYSRVERWLFNGLHSLDFAFWYDRRPLWDVVLIALSVGGLASSGIGLWVGCGRMRRAIERGWSRRRGSAG